MSSSFGECFRITTYGESHGPAVGVVIDGCPPNLVLSSADIQGELDRRRPGQSRLVSQRQESDTAELLSGVFEGRTLGTPIHILVRNEDQRSGDYEEIRTKYRPSHADYTYDAKFGIRDYRGGGRASARETVGRVAAGAVAKRVLAELSSCQVTAYVLSVGHLRAVTVSPDVQAIESNPVRCPDQHAAKRMVELIEAARKDGDSLGGVVEAVARRVPVGLGEPVFDKLEADLAKAMLSVPASKGFEIGSGFGGTLLRGSEHNDPFVMQDGRVRTTTNRSGGVQGGITNGEDIVIRVAFKPTATIMRPQRTVDKDGHETTLEPRGRHDPCVLPRAVPIVEAMMALVLADHLLRGPAGSPLGRSEFGRFTPPH